jgi:hypothetical protein
LDFIWLLFAHYISDIAFQSDWQAQNKGKYWYVLFSHAMIWTAIICIALVYIGIFEYWKVVFLISTHMVMDFWKARQPKTPQTWWYIYPDQVFHLLTLVFVYFL